MIPLWKLRRELARLGEETAARLANLYEPVLRKRHDAWRDRQPTPQDLGIGPRPKIAIFLIYQPKGVAPSILATLSWLATNGYAPLVVSNTPLSGTDRARLAPLAWRVFERPNFGYDFGGYRDGVLLLQRWGITPERLLILNDSVWMPTRPDSSLIARLEAAPADVVGGIEHPASTKRYGGTHRGHLESYLLLVNARACASDAFRAFWRDYPSSSKRLNAIRRGERQFASRMRDAGLTAQGLFSRQAFLDGLAQQETSFLQKTLTYASYVEPELAAEGVQLLESDANDQTWRDRVIQHIARTTIRRRFNAGFCYPSDALFGMDFIKKSPGPTGGGSGASLHSRMRRKHLEAVRAGDLAPLGAEVMAEIMAREDRSGSA